MKTPHGPFGRLGSLLGSLLLGAAALCASPAFAGPYSSLVIFGDSLSDTGNISIATGGAVPSPAQPYFNGRFSDGPVWVDHLAAGLGLTADVMPSLAGGNNYAFGGARTGAVGSPPGLLAQVAGLWAPTHPFADPNALYVMVGGGNDMRDARSAFIGNSLADQAGREAAAQAAVANLYSGLSLLASRGARHVLISNLPDLGNTPEAVGLGLVSASSDATARYNAAVLGLELLAEANLGLEVEVLDMYGIANSIRNDALNNGGAVYGITNVMLPCAGFTGSIGTSCAISAFSDALHPSARVHAIFGDAAVGLVVSEPASVALVLLAVAGLGLQRRRATRRLAPAH